MSDRALLLLTELNQWKNLHTFVNSEFTEYLITKDDLDQWIKEKEEEIRTRMAASQPICKYEFPKYYCELEMYDGDCSHCTDKLECFQPKEEKKDGN